jgi:hypothetical protein
LGWDSKHSDREWWLTEHELNADYRDISAMTDQKVQTLPKIHSNNDQMLVEVL